MFKGALSDGDGDDGAGGDEHEDGLRTRMRFIALVHEFIRFL